MHSILMLLTLVLSSSASAEIKFHTEIVSKDFVGVDEDGAEQGAEDLAKDSCSSKGGSFKGIRTSKITCEPGSSRAGENMCFATVAVKCSVPDGTFVAEPEKVEHNYELDPRMFHTTLNAHAVSEIDRSEEVVSDTQTIFVLKSYDHKAQLLANMAAHALRRAQEKCREDKHGILQDSSEKESNNKCKTAKDRRYENCSVTYSLVCLVPSLAAADSSAVRKNANRAPGVIPGSIKPAPMGTARQ